MAGSPLSLPQTTFVSVSGPHETRQELHAFLPSFLHSLSLWVFTSPFLSTDHFCQRKKQFTLSRIQTYNLLENLSFKPKLFPQKTLSPLQYVAIHKCDLSPDIADLTSCWRWSCDRKQEVSCADENSRLVWLFSGLHCLYAAAIVPLGHDGLIEQRPLNTV